MIHSSIITEDKNSTREVTHLIKKNTVMLNSVPEHLLNMPKKETKKMFNIGKITFYIFKILNAHILRQIFYLNMLNQYPEDPI
jgi:hypothetical protein